MGARSVPQVARVLPHAHGQICLVVPVALYVEAARIAVALQVEALVRVRPVVRAVAHPCRVDRLACRAALAVARHVEVARIVAALLAAVLATRRGYPEHDGHQISRVPHLRQRPVERVVEGWSAAQFVLAQRH